MVAIIKNHELGNLQRLKVFLLRDVRQEGLRQRVRSSEASLLVGTLQSEGEETH